jgi:hypothetical protein
MLLDCVIGLVAASMKASQRVGCQVVQQIKASALAYEIRSVQYTTFIFV